MTIARNLAAFASTANTSGAANGVSSGSWDIKIAGTKLNFNYGGITVMSLDSTGNLIVKADIAGYGTP